MHADITFSRWDIADEVCEMIQYYLRFVVQVDMAQFCLKHMLMVFACVNVEANTKNLLFLRKIIQLKIYIIMYFFIRKGCTYYCTDAISYLWITTIWYFILWNPPGCDMKHIVSFKEGITRACACATPKIHPVMQTSISTILFLWFHGDGETAQFIL